MRYFSALMLALSLGSGPLLAQNWSVNEVQYQRGTLDAPSFAGGGQASTHILTFQHASGWEYGDNFFFVDHLDDDKLDGFNDRDWYGEWYSNFSLGKITGNTVGAGPIKDVGIILGFNRAADAKVLKYLPGVRFSWDLPGFAFLNSDLTAYIDDSAGVEEGGAPTESNSWMLDINWAYPFSVGEQDFSIQGHMEYIASRENQFGEPVSHWILAQPQIRWDMGKALFDVKGRLFAGVEIQYWQNKLGDDNTDEKAIQLLVVARL
ncbi:nucleoside-binding protein [Lacimicrobium sp. SS2-24]|uniref:nucleoside-binding protein n=1 Tax=Lacimicrobium sp. SS2-24 TaxID=2005569 RepID=UPI000B4BB962|nr:nucleoside-binding protein [Lacimicrobium sp. SS2-24]